MYDIACCDSRFSKVFYAGYVIDIQFQKTYQSAGADDKIKP